MEGSLLTRLQSFRFSNPNEFRRHLQEEESNYNTFCSKNCPLPPDASARTECGQRETGSYHRDKMKANKC